MTSEHSDDNRNQLGSRQGSTIFRLFSGLTKKTSSSTTTTSSSSSSSLKGGEKISTAQPLKQQQQQHDVVLDHWPASKSDTTVKSPFETLHTSFAPSQSQANGFHMLQQKVSIRRIKSQMMTAVEKKSNVNDDDEAAEEEEEENSDSGDRSINEESSDNDDDDDEEEEEERCMIIGSFKEVINPLHVVNPSYTTHGTNFNSAHNNNSNNNNNNNNNGYDNSSKVKKMKIDAEDEHTIVGSFTETRNPLHHHVASRLRESESWDEERAKLVIGRNVKRWYFLKRFREYTSKSPELKDFRLRRQTLREILSTEITYVKGLNTCINYYLEPLKTKTKLLSANDHSTIFGNIVSIKDANEYMLRELEEAMEQWPVCNVGAVFVKYAQVFKIYVEYVKRYETAVKLLNERERKNKKLAEFLASQTELPESIQTLTSYLIMPVQRLVCLHS